MPDHFYMDDSKVRKPSRPGMGPLVAAGGIYVPSESVLKVGRSLDELSRRTGFPDGEEFKWSPDRGSWMAQNLKGDNRIEFFRQVLRDCIAGGSVAIVCINDQDRQPAERDTHEDDVTVLLLERVESATRPGRSVQLIVDRPGGGRKQENDYIAKYIETLRRGTAFKKFPSLAPPLCASSHQLRLLQAADILVGSVAAYVGGEASHSPRVFEVAREMLRTEGDVIGGVGVKIHPDFCYANLYHWLLGDSTFRKRGQCRPLPLRGSQYADSPDSPVVRSLARLLRV